MVCLIGRGNSPAPYSVVLLEPGFFAKANPLKPPSVLNDIYLVCAWFEIPSDVQPTISTVFIAEFLPSACESSWRMAINITAICSSTGISPDPSNACTIYQMWAFSVPLASISRNDRPQLNIAEFSRKYQTRNSHSRLATRETTTKDNHSRIPASVHRDSVV